MLRSDDKVRITAQLIHAPTEKHLWAESYERDLRDVLSLLNDVARSNKFVCNSLRNSRLNFPTRILSLPKLMKHF